MIAAMRLDHFCAFEPARPDDGSLPIVRQLLQGTKPGTDELAQVCQCRTETMQPYHCTSAMVDQQRALCNWRHCELGGFCPRVSTIAVPRLIKSKSRHLSWPLSD